eukprot:scaffold4483_cov214-Ochromonas_danica.AAC.1
MSFRSGLNSNFFFNDLKVNGTLTLENPLDVDSLTATSITCENLKSTGDAEFNSASVETLNVTTGTADNLTGEATLNEVTATSADIGTLNVTTGTANNLT